MSSGAAGLQPAEFLASHPRAKATPLHCALVVALLFAAPLGARDDVLHGLIKSLRGSGVYVRNAWTDKTRSAAPKSPTLAPLRGFPLRQGTSRTPSRRFFRSVAHEDAALVAVRGKLKPESTLRRELPRLWRRAPPSQRIFIAFARADLSASRTIRRALERDGYLCLTYVPGQTKPPWLNALALGPYYREAGVRLVLDSRAARASHGVRVESHAIAGRQGSKPCCKACYYLNGTLAGCEAVTCGAECASARGV